MENARCAARVFLFKSYVVPNIPTGMLRKFTTLFVLLPTALLAAGTAEDDPPLPPVNCAAGQVYDEKSKTCVAPKDSRLDQDTLYEAIRWLAYAGKYDEAQELLRGMPENHPGRLVYMGFTHRKLGDTALAMTYYARALEEDPDNFLARSYLGQAYVAQGNLALAKAQLDAIVAQGGRGTWPETALRNAIASGIGFDY